MRRTHAARLLACLCLCCASTACAQVAAPRTKQSGAVSVVRLPDDWWERREGVPDLQPAYIENLEVRRPTDAPPGEYLIGGIIGGDNDYIDELYKDIPPPGYTADFFAVNFNDNFRARAAAPQEWARARRVSTKPHWVYLEYDPKEEKAEFTYRGFRYAKTGDYIGRPVLLSPAGKWLAVFSYSGKKTKPDLLFGGGEPRTGDVFWDIYDASTGARIASWEARGVRDPSLFHKATTWIGDRYFFAPADPNAKSYLVFTLPEFQPIENPGTVRFPAWLGEGGQPMRLPDPRLDGDVRQPSREYEERLLADPARPGARELLFRLKDEWVELLPPLPPSARDGAGSRGMRARGAYSKSVYAVTLDGRYKVREASPEEWQRARPLKATHTQIDLDKTYESFGGTRRVYRFFEKTGAAWGTPRALAAPDDWLAVFSYTAAPGTKAAAVGELHVEVYNARPGTLMLSARAPYAGSADALFAGARWLGCPFLVLPLEESYGSCLLWMLPEMEIQK
ncbi:MAG TPA: hypothetical protein VM864_06390 [Pyrinomonadaceae bacterium]|jgi:hypothetical protein|nr:hypothetical protein [Pyrinomonadaceae bacterium]